MLTLTDSLTTITSRAPCDAKKDHHSCFKPVVFVTWSEVAGNVARQCFLLSAICYRTASQNWDGNYGHQSDLELILLKARTDVDSL